jgi:arabinogalactan endo-1,4-beta-galactosidase
MNCRKVSFIIVLLILALTSHLHSQNKLTSKNPTFIKGIDVSVLQQIEANGGVFLENGIEKDALQIFEENGLNYIRLRIWHTTAHGYNNLEKTLLMASRVKSSGLKLLLDIHYSDTWADPAHQTKPTAWNNLTFSALKDSVYQYTGNVITALKNQNTLPDIVQIGNEIICGMLWDEGRVCDQFNTPQQWNQLGDLIKESIRGINENIAPEDNVTIMIHIDRGGDNIGSQWFFNNLLAQDVEFDIIGLSYYPWWHGTLSDLESNTIDLANRYEKDIIIVEYAYPWTLEWYDTTHNLVGDSTQLHPGYLATVDGQTNFLSDLIDLVQNIPDNKGLGLFYWTPEWISTYTFGSPWENLTLFNFAGEVLSSISVFNSIPSDISVLDELPQSIQLYQNYPNPFNPATSIQYAIDSRQFVSLKVYDVLGNEVVTLVNEEKPAGNYQIDFIATDITSGIYFYKLRAGEFIKSKKMILFK